MTIKESIIQEIAASPARSTIVGEAHKMRGAAYEKLGQFENAIADYTAAIKTDSFCPEAYRARRCARMRLGDVKGAKQDGERARIYGRLAEIRTLKYRSREKFIRGDKKGGEEDWEKYLLLSDQSDASRKVALSALEALQ